MKKMIMMLLVFLPAVMFAQKFAKVSTLNVMQAMPDYAKAQGEYAAIAKQKDNDMKAMQDELNRKAQEFEKQKSAMNPTKQKETEEELQGLYQKIQQAYQDAQKELSEKQNAMMEPILAKIQNAIASIGKTAGYTMIFEDNAAVFFGDAVKDITEEVKTKLK